MTRKIVIDQQTRDELAPGVEEITEIYGPLPTIKAAEDAAATRPSRRQLEAVLDKMAQKGLIETAVVNGEKRWYARKED